MRYLKAALTPCVLVTMLMSPGAVLAIPCNTGVTGTCGLPLLGAGATDPNWTEVYAAPSGPPITAAALSLLTFGSAFANRNSTSWLPTGPDSGWITPSQPAGQAELGGQYVYHTGFMGAEPFGGRYSSDNELLEVFLNSALLPTFPLNGPADFGIWTNFNIAAVLNAGQNTLDFVVRNRGGGGIDTNPTLTGFRVEFSAVPEPGTWLLFASGLAGFSACRKSRRSKNQRQESASN